MAQDIDELRVAIREATQQAFTALREAHPNEAFYYYALVTTSDGLRPAPSASSHEGLARVLSEYQESGASCEPEELRWSEADSPYNLFGDEFFDEVERLFLAGGEHRDLPVTQYEAELQRRFGAMEGALTDLDRLGFFGRGEKRLRVVINVVRPGEEDEDEVLATASRLNPQECLAQLQEDLATKPD